MAYAKLEKTRDILSQIKLHLDLKSEYGAIETHKKIESLEVYLEKCLDEIKTIPIDEDLAKKEPSTLDEIKALRPDIPRVIQKVDEQKYEEKLEGALIGRMAGCILGAPVEGSPLEHMEHLAAEFGMPYPAKDYWSNVQNPWNIRYLKGKKDSYTRDKMNGVPPDDDIEYVLVGLTVAERHGFEFSTADVGSIWQELLPLAYTAEEVALNNLNNGINALEAADIDNPFCELIGADIRCDPWAYMCPGHPEQAAEFAHRDAYLSHRRQGIYGAMYFAAVISSALIIDDPMQALENGLSEIPKDCTLAKEIRWALDTAPTINNYKEARKAVDNRFEGMHYVHTINNACLTVFGISIGKGDFTKTIGETVAMGLDNDCTAATAGSIVGATIGIKNIPQHWYKPFNDTIISYSKTVDTFSIKDVLKRFKTLAKNNECLIS